MKDELASIHKNGTWELVNLPPDRKPVKCKWVYKLKQDSNGNVVRYKARLVAKGFSQTEGIDYQETFAPVVKYTTIRTMLALAAEKDWELHQMDVNSAFLYGDLDEEIYMDQPEGFKDGDQVCHLRKSLYGLKQASRVWYGKLDSFLRSLGFERSFADYSLYIDDQQSLLIAVYVDDLVISAPDISRLEELKQQLKEKFDMKDLGELEFFLGIAVMRDRRQRSIALSQERYLEKVLAVTGMENCKAVSTPVVAGEHLTPSTDEKGVNEHEYRVAIGSIMHAMLCTRPDLAYAISAVSRYSNRPGHKHWIAVKRILRYIQMTKYYKLSYGGQEATGLEGYSDADWGGELNTRRSTSGTVFLLNGGAISWASKSQRTVATSTTEAEYMALTQTTKEAIWIQRLLSEIGHATAAIKVQVDSQGCMALTKNPEHHQRTKHIDIQYHFNREAVQDGKVTLEYCPTGSMVADAMTKGLSKGKHETFTRAMGLIA
jgi:hypothetical protein